MYTRFFFIALLVITFFQTRAQDIWITRSGTITFHAGTSIEDIDGTNSEVASLLNIKTGELAFNVPIKSFRFTRSLMEEHFNENYMESTKYSKASFQGKISDPSKVNFGNDGTYTVTVEGDLSIHGVTKKVQAPGTITVAGSKIIAASTFKVLLSDYNIVIPGVVAEKIAKEASIEVKCSYEKKT